MELKKDYKTPFLHLFFSKQNYMDIFLITKLCKKTFNFVSFSSPPPSSYLSPIHFFFSSLKKYKKTNEA